VAPVVAAWAATAVSDAIAKIADGYANDLMPSFL
jgi:hypothetical protein